MSKRILIAGSGGIGRAVGLLLRELGELDVELIFGDADPQQVASAVEFAGGGDSVGIPFNGSTPELDRALASADLVLDCLPGGQATRVAAWALEHGCHYANLAPGFVNVLGNKLFQDFTRRFGVDKVDVLKMRVGALTRNAEAPHFYGFTWSPIGVATEYVRNAVVVRDWNRTSLDSLAEVQRLLIDGVPYEEATTSGGAADMPTALSGRVRHLDYKTLRYPGHWAWVRRQLDAIGEVPDRVAQLQDRMLSAIPQMQDDIVVIYAACEGRTPSGRRRLDAAYKVFPMELGGQRLRAIQSTTAAGLAECARILLTEDVRGALLQSQLGCEDYLNGPYCSAVYGHPLSEQLG